MTIEINAVVITGFLIYPNCANRRYTIMILLKGSLTNNILTPTHIYVLGHPRNSNIDPSDGYTVPTWEGYEQDGIWYEPRQYNVDTGEVIYQAVEPESPPDETEEITELIDP